MTSAPASTQPGRTPASCCMICGGRREIDTTVVHVEHEESPVLQTVHTLCPRCMGAGMMLDLDPHDDPEPDDTGQIPATFGRPAPRL